MLFASFLSQDSPSTPCAYTPHFPCSVTLGNNKLSCEELSSEIAKANQYGDEAQKAKKGGKPHNIGAILFFLPGAGITMKNVEEAVKAAHDRAIHLNQLKEKKNC